MKFMYDYKLKYNNNKKPTNNRKFSVFINKHTNNYHRKKKTYIGDHWKVMFNKYEYEILCWFLKLNKLPVIDGLTKPFLLCKYTQSLCGTNFSV